MRQKERTHAMKDQPMKKGGTKRGRDCPQGGNERDNKKTEEERERVISHKTCGTIAPLQVVGKNKDGKDSCYKGRKH